MSKQEVRPKEFQQLLLTCVDLPFLQRDRGKVDYMTDVMLTVLDFHMQGSVVLDSLDYFYEHVQMKFGIESHAQLADSLAGYPDTLAGNRKASLFLWNNHHGMRVESLRRLLTFFDSVGVTDQPSLHAWAKQAQFEQDFKGKVKGLGIAVFHWLQIRCGVSTIKPDVWVIKFAQRVMGRRLSEKALIEVFNDIAPLVGESLNSIDTTIWHYERRAMATKDVPEWRIVCWMLLKSRWKHLLMKKPFNGVSWKGVLDDKVLLRYDAAGLTLTGDGSLLGKAVHGITTVKLQQSVWNEGLTLTLWVSHDKALSEQQWGKLKERLQDSAWAVSNDPAFEASFEVEESLMMPPETTLEALKAWVREVVVRLMERLRELAG